MSASLSPPHASHAPLSAVPASPTAVRMGRLPSRSVAELRATRWDAIIVGAGHNGLACAAYLAQAGLRVLVLEAREKVGGACTLEEPWPGYRVSPCAYLAGLLHPLVVDELELARYGFRWTPATAGMFIPFEDGSSLQLWEDEARCRAEIAAFAPQDVDGWRAMGDLIQRVRNALRPLGAGDLWLGAPPSRAQIEARLDNDREAHRLIFEWSMADFVSHYLQDTRLQCALLGQGVIGTNASPFDPGTAYIRFHHASGRLGGLPGTWGYVQGGMGMVSFLLCDIALARGVQVATHLPVARIVPGEGVELSGGDRIHAPIVVSNADPRTTLRLVDTAADPAWRTQIEAIPMQGCTLKVSLALHELPNFRARPGLHAPHHRGQVNTPLTHDEWRAGYAAARNGELPRKLWTELYFQSAVDPHVAPPGKHLMSIFAQYVPYRLQDGDWDTRRAEAGDLAIEAVARHCTNLPQAVIHREVLGPPDIERKVGLTGGHIFQGECLPPYMWDRRPAYRTPMPGVYLCGAGTHPGGSVIGVNGRNAAKRILQDYTPGTNAALRQKS